MTYGSFRDNLTEMTNRCHDLFWYFNFNCKLNKYNNLSQNS